MHFVELFLKICILLHFLLIGLIVIFFSSYFIIVDKFFPDFSLNFSVFFDGVESTLSTDECMNEYREELVELMEWLFYDLCPPYSHNYKTEVTINMKSVSDLVSTYIMYSSNYLG